MAMAANHKILGTLRKVLAPVRFLANFAVLAGALALFGFLESSYAPDVFIGEEVYFKDPDSYSRMTRVRMLLDEMKPVREHDFENWPQGVTPHTTIPMDAWIASGSLITSAVGSRFDAIDFAGAYASPVLGGLLIVIVWAWGWRLDLPYRVPMLLMLAASPILIHGFLLGRPDHQSLQVFLIGTGVALEIAAWRKPGRSVWVAGGVVWGFAIWTSLYEPAILLGLVLLGIDGIRIGDPVSQFGPMFQRWSTQIGELSQVGPFSALLYSWTGWLLPLAPILLVITWRREKVPEAALLAVLVAVALGFTLWQARWGYFLAVLFAISLPFTLSGFRRVWISWPLFAVSLWPVLASWDDHFFPPPGEERVFSAAGGGGIASPGRANRRGRGSLVVVPRVDLLERVAHGGGQFASVAAGDRGCGPFLPRDRLAGSAADPRPTAGRLRNRL